MPPSVSVAVVDLTTSTPWNSVDGSMVKSGCCESIWSAVMNTSPFSMVPTCGRPRTETDVPTPASRSICTPVTRCRESVMVVSGSAPMFSAVMLSWMFGASRFTSIARICDARTPETFTVDSVTAFLSAALFLSLPLAFLASGVEADDVAGAACAVVACVVWPSVCVSANGDAATDVDTTANSDMVMANDKGCLRCTVDMGLDLVVCACRTSGAPWCSKTSGLAAPVFRTPS